VTLPTVTVVGSGASGVHFALTLLGKGYRVRMLDVGRRGSAPVLPDETLNGLKRTLDDPTAYFLGPAFGAVHLPGIDDEYYGIPPSKDFVFDPPEGFRSSGTGFAPLFSFARGGLAEAWTGGCYPLNAGELVDFPFSPDELLRHYTEVARRIGVSGAVDDLSRFMPVHDHLLPGLRLDEHSERLMESYSRARDGLNRQGVFMGRSRLATLSRPLGDRAPCDYLGRCLWGCPHGSLYVPSMTLQECLAHPGFEYVPGVEVIRLRIGAGGRVVAVVGRVAGESGEREFAVDRVALAAGALLSTRIFLASVLSHSGARVRLSGLMDNRQALMPFVNVGMIGRQFSAESYQYHQLGMGVAGAEGRDYVHGQITTLKTAMVHPLIQRLPFDLSTATFAFRALHAALGMVNVNFRDTRREANYVELAEGSDASLRIHYQPDEREAERVSSALGRVRKALFNLGCVVPPGMVHLRPMGASVHYAGTLPMTRTAAPFTTTEHCQSREFENLFLVDGATFPFLPAKNITFTLMANAVRVAEALVS
jgi:choline dehydrogenase-like flavoprotein